MKFLNTFSLVSLTCSVEIERIHQLEEMGVPEHLISAYERLYENDPHEYKARIDYIQNFGCLMKHLKPMTIWFTSGQVLDVAEVECQIGDAAYHEYMRVVLEDEQFEAASPESRIDYLKQGSAGHTHF